MATSFVVKDHIADSMCMELMLTIEVDGITHHSEEAIKKDDLRQTNLEAAGFTVVRFNDEQVLNDINAVYAFLEDWVDRKAVTKRI